MQARAGRVAWVRPGSNQGRQPTPEADGGDGLKDCRSAARLLLTSALHYDRCFECVGVRTTWPPISRGEKYALWIRVMALPLLYALSLRSAVVPSLLARPRAYRRATTVSEQGCGLWWPSVVCPDWWIWSSGASRHPRQISERLGPPSENPLASQTLSDPLGPPHTLQYTPRGTTEALSDPLRPSQTLSDPLQPSLRPSPTLSDPLGPWPSVFDLSVCAHWVASRFFGGINLKNH